MFMSESRLSIGLSCKRKLHLLFVLHSCFIPDSNRIESVILVSLIKVQFGVFTLVLPWVLFIDLFSFFLLFYLFMVHDRSRGSNPRATAAQGCDWPHLISSVFIHKQQFITENRSEINAGLNCYWLFWRMMAIQMNSESFSHHGGRLWSVTAYG